MKLKTATLIALVGVTASYVLSLVLHLKHGPRPLPILHSSLVNVPLILFFFTLFRKQQ